MRLILALWVGGIAIVTFLVTPPIFANFPRAEAGRVVGVIFPLYFPYLTALSLTTLVVFLLLRRGPWRAAHRWALALLLAATLANGVNQLWIHPESRALKAQIHAGSGVPPESPLRQRFSKLHGASMTLNLFVLLDGTILLVGGATWWERKRSFGGSK